MNNPAQEIIPVKEIRDVLTKKSAKPKLTSAPHTIYKLKIFFDNYTYDIWRVKFVDSKTKLDDLVAIFITVMGWNGHHLAEIVVDGNKYTSDELFSDNEYEASSFTVEKVFKMGTIGEFNYDFSDSWEHYFFVKDVLIDSKIETPFCTKCKGKCPPDECGGLRSFHSLVTILTNPNHPEYFNYSECFDEGFDPDDVSIDQINKDIRGLSLQNVYVNPKNIYV